MKQIVSCFLFGVLPLLLLKHTGFTVLKLLTVL